jgi:hypothetical protein
VASGDHIEILFRTALSAYLTGFRDEGGEAQVSGGFGVNRATQS